MIGSIYGEDSMNLLECINDYTKYVMNNSYVYKLQKPGIEVFTHYINSNSLNGEITDIKDIQMDRLLSYWIPRNKKYLSEVQAYQMVYTVHDIYQYILKYNNINKESDTPALLDIYGAEYMRVYKIRNMLLKMTKTPLLR